MTAHTVKTRVFGAWLFQIPEDEDPAKLESMPGLHWKLIGFRLGHFDSIEAAHMEVLLKYPPAKGHYVFAIGKGDHFVWEEIRRP